MIHLLNMNQKIILEARNGIEFDFLRLYRFTPATRSGGLNPEGRYREICPISVRVVKFGYAYVGTYFGLVGPDPNKKVVSSNVKLDAS